jgi:hypothetical protein
MKRTSSEAAIPADRGSSGASSGPPETPQSSTPPRISDHELIRRIGSGSYGEVWLARNAVGSLRAIKVIYRKTFDTDPTLRTRAQRYQKVRADLPHARKPHQCNAVAAMTSFQTKWKKFHGVVGGPSSVVCGELIF